MSGHVALVCLCVLFVWSVSSTVLREDGDQPSAETEDQAWTRMIEKVGQGRLDERRRGGKQTNCGVNEPNTSCDPRTYVLQSKIEEDPCPAISEQLSRCNERTLVLQARLDGRKEGAEETSRVFAEQLTRCNDRLDAAQQKIESHQKEAESLRAEVVTLKQQLEESSQNLKIKSQHLERLEKTKAQCDLEVTALTGDVAKLRGKEEEWNGKLGKQTSDRQQEMFEQILNSTKTFIRQESAKLGQDLVTLNSVIKQSTSDLNITLTVIKKELVTKSDEILKDINASKNKVQEGFDKMKKEGDTKYTALQTKHGEMLKIIESTENQVHLASGLVSLGDKIYYFSAKTTLTWHAARDFCVSRGLSLASIESVEENQRVFDHLKKLRMYNSWLGGSDEAQEGTWRWTGTGATLTYTNWKSGQPNGGTGENCLDMRFDGEWYDFSCAGTLSFVCEQHK